MFARDSLFNRPKRTTVLPASRPAILRGDVLEDRTTPSSTPLTAANLSGGYFDEAYYLRHNADVATAVTAGRISSGLEHYLAVGQHEGRDPNGYFGERLYLAKNADVAAAVAAGVYRSGYEHYLAIGQTENRQASWVFDPSSINTTAGLPTAYAQVISSAGVANPSIYFDAGYYLQHNADAAAWVNAGGGSALKHFVEYGESDERAGSAAFDPTAYLAANPDVAAAVSRGQYVSALEHYVLYGKDEVATGARPLHVATTVTPPATITATGKVITVGPATGLNASTITVGGNSPNYTNLQTAIDAAVAGDTIIVRPGTYAPPANPGFFIIKKSLTIISSGGAAVTNLNVASNITVCVAIEASAVTLSGFTLNGGGTGLLIYDVPNKGTLSGVSVSNLQINPELNAANAGHGIDVINTVSSVIDTVVVSRAYANGIYLESGSNNNIVMNSTVQSTTTQNAIAVQGSSSNVISGNTITGSEFSGILILNGSNFNRVEGNAVSGMRIDGIVSQNSIGNEIVKNTIVSGRPGQVNGAGIWAVAGANGTLISGNNVSNVPEGGIEAWNSSGVTIEGNVVTGSNQAGILITDSNQDIIGGPATTAPAPSNIIIHRNVFANTNANGGIVARFAKNLDVAYNDFYDTRGQAQGTGAIMLEGVTNVNFYENSMRNLKTGEVVYGPGLLGGVNYPTSTGVNIFRNRHFSVPDKYSIAPDDVRWDASVYLGGNYYSDFTSAVGNPSPTTPYLDFISGANQRGNGTYVDHYPFRDENLGQTYSVGLVDDLSGLLVGPGSTKTIRWQAPGAYSVDVYARRISTGALTVIGSVNAATGSLTWSVPVLASDSYQIAIDAKDSLGRVRASASGGSFSVAPSGIILRSPTFRSTVNDALTARVAWQRLGDSNPVSIQVSYNGGTSYTTVASGIYGNVADIAINRVGNASNVRIKVVDTATAIGDTTDGGIGLTVAGTGATTNIGAGGTLTIGSYQKLTWVATRGAATVDISFADGTQYRALATGVANTGEATVFIPEYFTINSNFALVFRDAAGNQVGATVFSPSFNIVYNNTAGTAINLLRLYNPNLRDHLYTTDTNEYNTLGTSGFTREGADGALFTNSVNISGVQAIPYYRLYDTITGHHLYTTDRNEYFTLRANARYSPDGIVGYVLPTQVAGSKPYYRLASNFVDGLHLWSTDANEYNTLGASGAWTKEGIIGYLA